MRPRVGRVERADQVQQRRLARAARPHDADELARVHVQVDAAQRLDPGSSFAVGLLDGLQLDHEPVLALLVHDY